MCKKENKLLSVLNIKIDIYMLRVALTHRSYAYEHGDLPNNERLEFLGDSILGFIVTENLYFNNPYLKEGDLAKLKSSLISADALSVVAKDLSLGEFIYLGRGERNTGGKHKKSILANTVEAIIGACYITNGINITKILILNFISLLEKKKNLLLINEDWKSNIQEIVANKQLGKIEYLIKDYGPDHSKIFKAKLMINKIYYGLGIGKSKKEAERQAAKNSLLKLNSIFSSSMLN